EAEALKLSPEERVSLADRLLASVASTGDVDDAWSAALARRPAAVEAGRTDMVPFEEAIQRASRALSCTSSSRARRSKSWSRARSSMRGRRTRSLVRRSSPNLNVLQRC